MREGKLWESRQKEIDTRDGERDRKNRYRRTEK